MIRLSKRKEGSPEITSGMEFEIELMQRHVEMLKSIIENEPIGIIRLSELLEYPQHKVRYSLRLLEKNGLIEPSPEGAITTKKVYPFLAKIKKAIDSMDKTLLSLEDMLEEARREAADRRKQ